MSTAKFDTLSNLAGTQSVPVATVAQGSAKAWVNFNGTGTVSIRAAFNVSSITDNGTGNYTVNFTNPMPNSNYSIGTGPVAIGSGAGSLELTGYTTSTVSVITRYAPGGAFDWASVFIQIFR